MAEGIPPLNTWCHVEVYAKDVERAKSFYGEVFGWQFQHIPEMNYTLYSTAKGSIGGGVSEASDETPNQLINYVYVEDIDATLSRIENNGGKTVIGTKAVGPVGWMALVEDPEGNLFGLWKSNPEAQKG